MAWGARDLISTQASSYLAAVYSNETRNRAERPFLNEDRVAEHLNVLAKEGLIYDARGLTDRESTTLHLVLVDQECDFKRVATTTFTRVAYLRSSYRILLLQPFAEALVDFKGDPLSDDALEWRKQFSVVVPYVPQPGRASRPGTFMIRPALKFVSDAKAADRRRAARDTPLPPAGEDGL